MYDTLERRCPRLGSPVRFHYCRTAGQEHQPCFKVLDCWWEQFDVAGFFRQRLDPQAFERLTAAPPPDKVASLVELIRQAQERVRKS